MACVLMVLGVFLVIVSLRISGNSANGIGPAAAIIGPVIFLIGVGLVIIGLWKEFIFP